MSQKLFYGKYRGKVTDNNDPLKEGRLKAEVPFVLGDEQTGWASPCVPYAGNGVGFFFIPPIGANVWIEFERGEPDHPVWSGCFWSSGETPEMPADPNTKVIKTDSTTITLCDQAGAKGITIQTANGLKVTIGPSDIVLVNGNASVRLTPTRVSIHDSRRKTIR